ncbi:MAG: heme NO-binding domain-containing protein [Leptolyngbyaceae cyanobacterium]
MYGLINRAIQDMLCEQFGEEAWAEIRQHAGIQERFFLVLEPYPDEITHKLVASASQVLSVSPSEIMQAFGHYWIRYTGTVGYKEIIEMGGESLKEFLQNLDDLHSRVGIQFPALKPPSFECEEVDDETLEVHYASSRKGLAPMVVGLIEGLGSKFSTEVEVTQTASREYGAEQDTFQIRYKAQ